MLVDKFDYDLPKKFIADSPVTPRDYARLLVYDKDTGQVETARFFNLPEYLTSNDVLIFNNSKVIPARLIFSTQDKQNEIFFLEQIQGLWKCLIKPGKRFKTGTIINVHKVRFEVKHVDKDGFRYLDSSLNRASLLKFLKNYGVMPVPPYISGSKYRQEDYNTVYSKPEGSVAAPTAGLHFTDQLMARIKARGTAVEFVTLHVGLGTFLPFKVKDSRDHKMHEENYNIDYLTAVRLNNYLKQGKRLIAVGTTSVRVLEDNFARFGKFKDGQFSTRIFIRPGYKWSVIDTLITNFHLPKSTLIMLVSALIGRTTTLKLYEYAKKLHFRFFSFGDGMLITSASRVKKEEF
jgi:S-adenosylmethionine:tRNA ribosyltransferase-isomerase